MLFSVFPLSIRSQIIPFELFKLLCFETVTFKLKNEVIFRSLSICAFLFVSTSKVLFLSFFTDFVVPIRFVFRSRKALEKSLDLSYRDFV